MERAVGNYYVANRLFFAIGIDYPVHPPYRFLFFDGCGVLWCCPHAV